MTLFVQMFPRTILVKLKPEQKDNWKCVQCKSAEPRSDNTNTPVRRGNNNVTLHRGGRTHKPISPADHHEDSSIMEVSYMDSQSQLNITTPPNNFTTLKATASMSRETEMLVAELRLFREEMRAMTQQLHDLRVTMANLTTRIDSCDRRVDGLCSRVEALESKSPCHDNDQQANSTLVDTIAQLRSELNDRDQDLLLNDVEISCVPEERGENTMHVAITLSQKLGVTLTEQDIVSITRVGRAPQQLLEGGQGPAARPRLIVMRLARRAVRDQLLQAARVRRGATTEGAGLPGSPQRFYVNERLTPTNRRLFQMARELKQHHGWRFVWTRDGRIYARQRSGEDIPRHRIRTELDLARVFSSHSI
jgi:hypothetical protein